MSLFNSAIQTLSSMAINEAGVEIPKTASQDVVASLVESLNTMPYVNADECKFLAEMVVVRKSSRLGRYLIEMEDLSRYMITNGIHNAKQAICNILEVNDLQGQFNNTAIVIDETSLLEEIEPLGYAVSNNLSTPPKGLGLGFLTKNQDDFNKLRHIANTKQLMDVLTGRYGIPLIKKNYQQQGLLEAVEDAQMKKGEDETIIHEGDKKKSKKDIDICPDCGDIKGECDCKDDSKDENPKKSKKDDAKLDIDDVEDTAVEESVNYDAMDSHQLRIQRLKEIAAGKYDDEW